MGSGIKNIKTIIANARNRELEVTIRLDHSPYENFKITAANCTPIILPILVQVDQSPTINPLFFFGNQLLIIVTYEGHEAAVNKPKKKNIG